MQSSCGQLSETEKSRKAKELVKYIPKPIGWTNDYVHVFSKDEVESLDSLISTFEKSTTVQFSVATIDSSMMGPMDFESYTLLMLNTWGVGTKKKNNGILIVIAPDMKRVRIQNGYGIEKVMSDEETKKILDTIFIPRYRQSLYFIGTKEGIIAIMQKLQQAGL